MSDYSGRAMSIQAFDRWDDEQENYNLPMLHGVETNLVNK